MKTNNEMDIFTVFSGCQALNLVESSAEGDWGNGYLAPKMTPMNGEHEPLIDGLPLNS